MSLKHAILGLLSFKPQTGYEIKANFNQSIRYLWNADQAQIYRVLSKIANEGLATSKIIEQHDRPNKKVYELTQAGQSELRRWLATPVPTKNQRNAELLQVFFSGQISDDEIVANLKRLKDDSIAALAGLSALENGAELFNPENAPGREHYFFKMTLKLGIRNAKMNIEWINEMISEFENTQSEYLCKIIPKGEN